MFDLLVSCAGNETLTIVITLLPLYLTDFAGDLPSATSLTAGSNFGIGQKNDCRGGLSSGSSSGTKVQEGPA
jgi:hypothetical protein